MCHDTLTINNYEKIKINYEQHKYLLEARFSTKKKRKKKANGLL